MSLSDRGKRALLISVVVCVVVLVVIGSLFVLAVEKDRSFSFPLSTHEMYVKDPQRWVLATYNSFIRSVSPQPPIIPLEAFGEHRLFEEHWRDIRDEALKVYETTEMPSFHQLSDWFDPISSDKWKTFVLKWYGQPVEKNCAKCPITAGLIERCDSVKAAMFSILLPGMVIPPHRGPSEGCMRYHLALKVPKNRDRCFIRVHDQEYHWKEGEGVLFMDTYEHSVVNDTDEMRIVLFMDVLRPLPPGLYRFNRWLQSCARLSSFINSINARAEVPEKVR
jgi:aspartyl/asparaginyl beta-hydroxylase (cupin superfamily)